MPGPKPATFGFAAGYAERRKWVHNETWQIFKEDLPKATLQPARDINEDWLWARQHWPYLHETEKPR